VTYLSVLRDREYRALFTADGLSVVGDQVTRIAVALLVLDRTGSAFASAATYAVALLTWLVGGPLLSALADRYPRRRLMVTCDLLRLLLVASLAVPGLALWVVFVLLILAGLLAPPFEAARSSLLADTLEGERYVVGNALSSGVAQAGQVVGFVAGGAVVALLGTSAALLLDAGTFALSALLLILLVRARPVSAAVDAPTSMLHQVMAGLHLVARTPALRRLLGWGALAAGAVIAPEALAVAVSESMGGGPLRAGVLTAAVPAGFVLGSCALLRVPAAKRPRLFPSLVLLSCLPLLLSPFIGDLWLLTAVWVLAGTGSCLQLIANAAFVQAVPPPFRGRAFGAAGSALMAVQGVVVLLAGGLAELASPRAAVATFAAAGALVVAVAVVRGGQGETMPQGTARSGRSTAR